LNITLTPLTEKELLSVGTNDSMVQVVLEIDEDTVEYYDSYRIDDWYYLTCVDGLAVIGVIEKSEKHLGYYEMIKDIATLKLNEETERLISEIDSFSVSEFLMLVERFGVDPL
jgi:hypothetical protein